MRWRDGPYRWWWRSPSSAGRLSRHSSVGRLASAQFTLAMVGLVPALVLVLAALLGKRRLAIAAVVVGVPLYLVWALLLDAAVHGWDDLKLLP